MPDLPDLLVLGILPSDASRRDWRAGVANRDASRRLWLAAPPPPRVTARFVLVADFAAGGSSSASPSSTSLRRRRLLSERRHALQREASAHTSDLVLLPSAPSGSSCACAELIHAWFAHALATWPAARYYGKTEDDVLIALPALLWELARLPFDRKLWWGLMAWTGNGNTDHPRIGCWAGGFEDDPMHRSPSKTLAKERGCPEGATPIAPSPTHELDVRSAPLARDMAACAYPAQWLASMPGARRCPNECAAVQGHWLTRCARDGGNNVTLAHATWTKVHSNSHDHGWRPFAPPSNLTLALDMNLGDKKLRELGAPRAWEAAAAAMRATTASTFPPLLYEYAPGRRAGESPLLIPLNRPVAELHHTACRWGGCHPSRDDGYVEWPAWQASAPWPATSAAAIGYSHGNGVAAV